MSSKVISTRRDSASTMERMHRLNFRPWTDFTLPTRLCWILASRTSLLMKQGSSTSSRIHQAHFRKSTTSWRWQRVTTFRSFCRPAMSPKILKWCWPTPLTSKDRGRQSSMLRTRDVRFFTRNPTRWASLKWWARTGHSTMVRATLHLRDLCLKFSIHCFSCQRTSRMSCAWDSVREVREGQYQHARVSASRCRW